MSAEQRLTYVDSSALVELAVAETEHKALRRFLSRRQPPGQQRAREDRGGACADAKSSVRRQADHHLLRPHDMRGRCGRLVGRCTGLDIGSPRTVSGAGSAEVRVGINRRCWARTSDLRLVETGGR